MKRVYAKAFWKDLYTKFWFWRGKFPARNSCKNDTSHQASCYQPLRQEPMNHIVYHIYIPCTEISIVTWSICTVVCMKIISKQNTAAKCQTPPLLQKLNLKFSAVSHSLPRDIVSGKHFCCQEIQFFLSWGNDFLWFNCIFQFQILWLFYQFILLPNIWSQFLPMKRYL